MGILGRLSSLVKSNVNGAIDSMQDPAKEIDQMVRDMEESARQARTEVGQCMAEEKRLGRRVADLDSEVAEWGRRAEMAVRASDDGLAKEALLRKGEKEAERGGDPEGAPGAERLCGSAEPGALRQLDERLKQIQAPPGDAEGQGARQPRRQPAVGEDLGVQ